MDRQPLTTGDVVTINGRRGRILAAEKGRCEVLLNSTTGAVECGAHEVRRINSWWNTPEMRAAFHQEGRRRRLRDSRRRHARRRADRIATPSTSAATRRSAERSRP